MKGVLKTHDLDEYQRHYCPCQKYAWPPLSRSLYEDHATDKCPHCKAFRFTRAADKKLEPQRVGQSCMCQHECARSLVHILSCMVHATFVFHGALIRMFKLHHGDRRLYM